MSLICPTILATTKDDFTTQLNRVRPFAERIQIDLMDGDFTAVKSIPLTDVELPADIVTDIHMMYRCPQDYLNELIALKPHLVIVHAESDCDIPLFASQLRVHGIRTGAAVLQNTSIENIAYLLPHIQHVLIFSGDLGHFGGTADMALVAKAAEAKQYNAHLEIGWDGGANESNCQQLAKNGIDVINVGGAIQKAAHPETTYATMKAKVTSA